MLQLGTRLPRREARAGVTAAVAATDAGGATVVVPSRPHGQYGRPGGSGSRPSGRSATACACASAMCPARRTPAGVWGQSQGKHVQPHSAATQRHSVWPAGRAPALHTLRTLHTHEQLRCTHYTHTGSWQAHDVCRQGGACRAFLCFAALHAHRLPCADERYVHAWSRGLCPWTCGLCPWTCGLDSQGMQWPRHAMAASEPPQTIVISPQTCAMTRPPQRRCGTCA